VIGLPSMKNKYLVLSKLLVGALFIPGCISPLYAMDQTEAECPLNDIDISDPMVKIAGDMFIARDGESDPEKYTKFNTDLDAKVAACMAEFKWTAETADTVKDYAINQMAKGNIFMTLGAAGVDVDKIDSAINKLSDADWAAYESGEKEKDFNDQLAKVLEEQGFDEKREDIYALYGNFIGLTAWERELKSKLSIDY
jgi:hypothetical protein